MTHYGHHAQNDRWAAEVVFPGMRDGYFVEAGACGGHLGSASYVLERELGWNGICVEPVDEYYETLRRRRSCATDPRCLSDTTGDVVEFLSYAEDPARSGIQALNKNVEWAEQRNARGKTYTKETVTLTDLLEQHDAPPTVHYLCLDVEGAESLILGAYDFENARRILALSVEGDRCDELLRGRGYSRVRNPFAPPLADHYFVHTSLRDRLHELLID